RRHRRLVRAEHVDHAQPVQPRHLHVQKHQVRRVLFNHRHGFQTVVRRGHDIDFTELAQQKNQLVQGRCFVVRDHGRNSVCRTNLHPVDRIAVGVLFSRPCSDRPGVIVLPSPSPVTIAPAEGKLGVLIPGIGAVSTTFIAGVEAVKRGLGLPVGSLTQLATIRLGKRTDGRSPYIKDFVPLAGLDDLVFGGWDIYEDTAYEAAAKAQVLEKSLLEQVKEPLQAIQPMKAVFDHEYVRRIDGPNKRTTGTKMDKAHALMADIEEFRRAHGCSRLIMIWCGSTEVFHRPSAVHETLAAFEEGLRRDDPEIAPSQIYAYAALMSGVPYANGAPNL